MMMMMDSKSTSTTATANLNRKPVKYAAHILKCISDKLILVTEKEENNFDVKIPN